MKRLTVLLILIFLISCGKDDNTTVAPVAHINSLTTQGHLVSSEMVINYRTFNESQDLLPNLRKTPLAFYDTTCVEKDESQYMRTYNLTKRDLLGRVVFHFGIQNNLVKFRSHVKLYHNNQLIGEHCNHSAKEGRIETELNKGYIYFPSFRGQEYLAFEIYSVNGLMILEDKSN